MTAQEIYAVSGKYVYKSPDGGLTWESGVQADASLNISCIFACGNNHVLAGTFPTSGAAGKILQSINGGATWTTVLTLATYAGVTGFSRLPSGRIIAGIDQSYASSTTTAIVVYSDDTGQNWKTSTILTGVSSIAKAVYGVIGLSNGRAIASTGHSSGGEYNFYSDDLTGSWSATGGATQFGIVKHFCEMGSVVVAASSSYAGQYNISTDGIEWAAYQTISGFVGVIKDLAYVNGILYAFGQKTVSGVTSGAFFKSTDHVNWDSGTIIDATQTYSGYADFDGSTLCETKFGNTFVASGGYNSGYDWMYVYWSSDDGATINKVQIDATNHRATSAISAAPPVPVITGISPSGGPTAGGTEVTITGSGFTNVTEVYFGAAGCESYTIDSDTQITAESPANTSGVVDITVVAAIGGTSETSSDDKFTYYIPVEFTSITPTTGPKAGGSPVLIVGTGFTGATSVTFGGDAAASFTVLDDTQIAAVTPAHAAGAVDVVITTLGAGTGTDAYIYTDDTSTIIDTTIEEGIDDAMAEATFSYDGTGVGLSDGDYLTKVTISMTDKDDVAYVKFVGVCVNGNGDFGLADDKIALSAFDYRFFLSNNIDAGDRTLLPADQQGTTNFGRTLSYKSPAIAFSVGLWVYGATSKANGRIMAIDFGTNTLTLYPAFGEFVDSEELHVGGTLYAYADGVSIDIPYSTYLGGVIYPENWILRLLGGSSGWSTTTGIYPYKIVSTTHDSDAIWDTDPVTEKVYYAKVFTFGEEANLKESIAEVTKYLRRIYHAKPVQVSSVWYCGFYWVRQSQIDDATYGLDLPEALAITAGSSDNDLDDTSISLVASGEDRIQKVHVWSETLWGDRIDAYYPSTYFSILGKDYSKRHAEITTQSDLEDLAEDVYNAKSTLSKMWTATLIQRPDVEKYQKLTLSGYGPQVPDGTYRIIHVRYTDGLTENKTQIWFINNDAFLSQMRLGWTYQDSIQQTVDLVNYLNSQENKNEKVQFVNQNTDGSWNVITADGKPDVLPAWSND